MPCVYLAGNHEFYNGSIRQGLAEGKRAAQEFPGVRLLENEAVTIGGVMFIGATLDGLLHRGSPASRCARARADEHYCKIARQPRDWQRFVPEAAAWMDQDSRRFIENALAPLAFPSSSSPTICREQGHCRIAFGHVLTAF
jgi:hypothetical protein